MVILFHYRFNAHLAGSGYRVRLRKLGGKPEFSLTAGDGLV